MHKCYNKDATLSWKRSKGCLWKWMSKLLQLVSYWEVVEGGLFEIRWKVLTADIYIDVYGSRHTVNWGS